ncbi:hypothetical protein KDC22_11380 [Paenibacillus tritici]|uniref:hypothetical protein n=1 Tax=Paenibacillus tritici TaxID=1873425 RepID=UPI001BA9FA24|nr:hypothetical protein [Paenibacillus tritici]QUL57019.1 hypothetical protein KDC22_11380 [Paenibacillus tritici]
MKRKLGEMMDDLLRVDDEAWGMYAFSRDILNRRIPPVTKIEMLGRARACGIEYARRMIRDYGTSDVREIAGKLNLKLELRSASMTGKRVLFASYTPPDKIEIMEEPVLRAAELVRAEQPALVELFQQAGIMNTILGHEIFHGVEDRYAQEIYTRTERILLWKLLGLKNYSTIRTLSEVGAMAFTQELNRLSYSPFILDILLYYSYDSASAEIIYRDVLGVSSGKV